MNPISGDHVRILIVDDHPLVRDGLKARLHTHPHWSVCGEAESPPDAMRLARELQPDLVIVDLSLRNGSGLDLTKQLHATFPGLRILVCSMHDENLYAQRAVQAGALGYLHKQQAAENLDIAIERALAGKLFLSDNISAQVLTKLMREPNQPLKTPIEQLTDRELQVFESIGQGKTVNQIASALFLSSKTIETYRDRTKRKLNLKTSAELTRYAVKWVTEHAAG
jgi:DNA-binding NarL/FixJ family response regulator